MKTTINGQDYSRTQIKNNILRVWNNTTTTDRHDWYGEAHSFCRDLASQSGYALEKVVGVVAALSPMLSWPKNRQYAEDTILNGVNPLDLPVLKLSRRKTAAILALEEIAPGVASVTDIKGILSGPKTTAFFMNILCPLNTEYITIDRHAISIALGVRLTNTETGLTARQYDFLKYCYAYTAEMTNVSPLLMQSATWVSWRQK